MKARVKKMVLPDAPQPTLPIYTVDQQEKEHCLRMKEFGETLYMSKEEHDKARDKAKGRATVWTPSKELKFVRLWNDGLRINVISRELGVSEKCINDKVKEFVSTGKIKPRKKHLTDEEIEELKKLKGAGVDPKSLTKRYGVHLSTIYYVWRKK